MPGPGYKAGKGYVGGKKKKPKPAPTTTDKLGDAAKDFSKSVAKGAKKARKIEKARTTGAAALAGIEAVDTKKVKRAQRRASSTKKQKRRQAKNRAASRVFQGKLSPNSPLAIGLLSSRAQKLDKKGERVREIYDPEGEQDPKKLSGKAYRETPTTLQRAGRLAGTNAYADKVRSDLRKATKSGKENKARKLRQELRFIEEDAQRLSSDQYDARSKRLKDTIRENETRAKALEKAGQAKKAEKYNARAEKARAERSIVQKYRRQAKRGEIVAGQKTAKIEKRYKGLGAIKNIAGQKYGTETPANLQALNDAGVNYRIKRVGKYKVEGKYKDISDAVKDVPPSELVGDLVLRVQNPVNRKWKTVNVSRDLEGSKFLKAIGEQLETYGKALLHPGAAPFAPEYIEGMDFNGMSADEARNAKIELAALLAPIPVGKAAVGSKVLTKAALGSKLGKAGKTAAVASGKAVAAIPGAKTIGKAAVASAAKGKAAKTAVKETKAKAGAKIAASESPAVQLAAKTAQGVKSKTSVRHAWKTNVNRRKAIEELRVARNRGLITHEQFVAGSKFAMRPPSRIAEGARAVIPGERFATRGETLEDIRNSQLAIKGLTYNDMKLVERVGYSLDDIARPFTQIERGIARSKQAAGGAMVIAKHPVGSYIIGAQVVGAARNPGEQLNVLEDIGKETAGLMGDVLTGKVNPLDVDYVGLGEDGIKLMEAGARIMYRLGTDSQFREDTFNGMVQAGFGLAVLPFYLTHEGLVHGPIETIKKMGEMAYEDVTHRWEPALDGDWKEFMQRIDAQGAGAAWALLDLWPAAAAGSWAMKPIAVGGARALKVSNFDKMGRAERFLTRSRNPIQFSHGPGGIEYLETSNRLFKTIRQRGTDAARVYMTHRRMDKLKKLEGAEVRGYNDIFPNNEFSDAVLPIWRSGNRGPDHEIPVVTGAINYFATDARLRRKETARMIGLSEMNHQAILKRYVRPMKENLIGRGYHTVDGQRRPSIKGPNARKKIEAYQELIPYMGWIFGSRELSAAAKEGHVFTRAVSAHQAGDMAAREQAVKIMVKYLQDHRQHIMDFRKSFAAQVDLPIEKIMQNIPTEVEVLDRVITRLETTPDIYFNKEFSTRMRDYAQLTERMAELDPSLSAAQAQGALHKAQLDLLRKNERKAIHQAMTEQDTIMGLIREYQLQAAGEKGNPVAVSQTVGFAKREFARQISEKHGIPLEEATTQVDRLWTSFFTEEIPTQLGGGWDLSQIRPYTKYANPEFREYLGKIIESRAISFYDELLNKKQEITNKFLRTLEEMSDNGIGPDQVRALMDEDVGMGMERHGAERLYEALNERVIANSEEWTFKTYEVPGYQGGTLTKEYYTITQEDAPKTFAEVRAARNKIRKVSRDALKELFPDKQVILYRANTGHAARDDVSPQAFSLTPQIEFQQYDMPIEAYIFRVNDIEAFPGVLNPRPIGAYESEIHALPMNGIKIKEVNVRPSKLGKPTENHQLQQLQRLVDQHEERIKKAQARIDEISKAIPFPTEKWHKYEWESGSGLYLDRIPKVGQLDSFESRIFAITVPPVAFPKKYWSKLAKDEDYMKVISFDGGPRAYHIPSTGRVLINERQVDDIFTVDLGLAGVPAKEITRLKTRLTKLLDKKRTTYRHYWDSTHGERRRFQYWNLSEKEAFKIFDAIDAARLKAELNRSTDDLNRALNLESYKDSPLGDNPYTDHIAHGGIARFNKLFEEAGLGRPFYWASHPQRNLPPILREVIEKETGVGGANVSALPATELSARTMVLHRLGIQDLTPERQLGTMVQKAYRLRDFDRLNLMIENYSLDPITLLSHMQGHGRELPLYVRKDFRSGINTKKKFRDSLKNAGANPNNFIYLNLDAYEQLMNNLDISLLKKKDAKGLLANVEGTNVYKYRKERVDTLRSIIEALDDGEQGRWVAIHKDHMDPILGEFRKLDNRVFASLYDYPKALASRLLLAPNISWNQFQIYANASMAGLAGAGPRSWIEGKKFYNELSPQGKQAFDFSLGVQTHHLDISKLNHNLYNFWENFFTKSYAYRRYAHERNVLDAFFWVDRQNNIIFRRGVLYNNMKKEAYKRMGKSTNVIIRTIEDAFNKHGRKNKGKKSVDQVMEEIANDSKTMSRLAKEMESFMGDYLNFTPAERHYMQRAAMFYGFLRHSITFTLRTLPAKHPVRLGLMSTLVEMEIENMKEVTGFQDYDHRTLGKFYMKGPVNISLPLIGNVEFPGDPESGLVEFDLGRASVAGNFLIEAMAAPNPELRILGSTNPVIIPPLEAASGINFYRGTPLRGDKLPTTPWNRGEWGALFGNNGGVPIIGSKGEYVLDRWLSTLIRPYRLAKEATADYPFWRMSDDSMLGNQKPYAYSLSESGEAAKEAYKDTELFQEANESLPLPPGLFGEVLPFAPSPSPITRVRDFVEEQKQTEEKATKSATETRSAYEKYESEYNPDNIFEIAKKRKKKSSAPKPSSGKPSAYELLQRQK